MTSKVKRNKFRKPKRSENGEGSMKGLASKPPQIAISQAKGRPMLNWVGKRALRHVTAFPAQHIETFDPNKDAAKRIRQTWSEWPNSYPKGGLLFHGDNKEVLGHLLANGFRGKINLVYIDPPFDSNADYVRKISLRGPKGTVKLSGEGYTLGEQIQYTDIWANDNYLQFMYERFLLLKELLSDTGSIILHANTTKSHHLRCLLDEVFGEGNMRNEITWHYDKYQMGQTKQFVDNTDRLFWYSKGQAWTYHLQSEKLEKPKELLAKGWDSKKGVIVNLRNEEGKTYKIKIDSKKIDDFWQLPQIAPFRAQVEKTPGEFVSILINKVPIDNVWLIPYIAAPSFERTGYPTQKPEALLNRIIQACSAPGDLVLDCFCGSGTTQVVAQELGRKWIGCDINKGALQTTAKRVQAVIQNQLEEAKKPHLIQTDDKTAEPAQFSYIAYRVNDYDLTIQHNEAVNLACEHIGIERTRTDSFFDGTLGKALVKIIPFGRPLTPLDLGELKRELEARPDEDRSITFVCLGIELAARTEIEEWNRLRKGKNAINKVDVIELRTDPKYGKFISHKSAHTKVSIKRSKEKILVEVQDFISPTVIERLQDQAGFLKPKIEDWRSMVDCIMIDDDHDGKVFNVTLTDIPEKKTDFVRGSYELSAPAGKTTVAVKIIDMLGEEIICRETV